MQHGYQLRLAQEVLRSFRFAHRNRFPAVQRWVGEIGAAPFQEDLRRAIDSTAGSGYGFQKLDRLRPAPILIGRQACLVAPDPFRGLGAGTLGHAEELIDGEVPRPTIERHPVEPAHNDRIAGGVRVSSPMMMSTP